MKQNITLIITIVIVVLVLFSYKLIEYKAEVNNINSFNKTFLEYNRNNLHGTDITSAINKATNHNEKSKIKKDESGNYIPDDQKSIKIFVKFEEEGQSFPMEKLMKVGIQDFTKYFGELSFECKNVVYHDNGNVSEMYFEAINY